MLTEIIVIIKAIERRQESLILTIEEYILYKYEIELGDKDKERTSKKDVNLDERYINYEINNKSVENEVDLGSTKTNFRMNNQKSNKIKDKDIADVIRKINLSKNKKSHSNIPD